MQKDNSKKLNTKKIRKELTEQTYTRASVGREKYGDYLYPDTEINALDYALEELIDCAKYLKKEIRERDDDTRLPPVYMDVARDLHHYHSAELLMQACEVETVSTKELREVYRQLIPLIYTVKIYASYSAIEDD